MTNSSGPDRLDDHGGDPEVGGFGSAPAQPVPAADVVDGKGDLVDVPGVVEPGSPDQDLGRPGGSRSSLVFVLGAVVVVVLVVAVSLLFKQIASSSNTSAGPAGAASSTSTASGGPVSPGDGVIEAVLPKGVDPESLAVRVAVNPDAPVLSVWEDFQCPACGVFEAASAGVVRELVGQGKLVIQWRPVSFLDDAFGNNASSRATAAWGCAIDQGVAPQYHDVVFANQPAVEGQGFSDEQLLEFGATAGLTGEALREFESCVASGRYLSWSVTSTGLFREAGLSSTPYATLDGEPVDVRVLVEPDKLRDLILDSQ